MRITFSRANLVRNTETFSNMDPYVIMEYGSNKFRTQTKDDAGKNPVWDETFELFIKNVNDEMSIKIMDEDVMVDDTVGTRQIPVKEVLGGERLTGLQNQSVDIFYHGKVSGSVIISTSFEKASANNPPPVAATKKKGIGRMQTMLADKLKSSVEQVKHKNIECEHKMA